jgi:hypothetical protein
VTRRHPALTLFLLLWAAPATAATGDSGGVGDLSLALEVDVTPTFYSYEESGEGLFDGIETDWEAFAVRSSLEVSAETEIGLAPVLRLAELTSVEEEERNNFGQPPSDMRIRYFIEVQPAFQARIRTIPGIVLAPEISWDLDWYRQRRGGAFGRVDEDVFWHGPAIGIAASADLGRHFFSELRYRHSFLIQVDSSNEAARSVGIDHVGTHGHRDVAQVRAGLRLSEHLSLVAGYRFESARIDASGTEVVPVPGGAVAFQFPHNEHTLHSGELGVELVY